MHFSLDAESSDESRQWLGCGQGTGTKRNKNGSEKERKQPRAKLILEQYKRDQGRDISCGGVEINHVHVGDESSGASCLHMYITQFSSGKLISIWLKKFKFKGMVFGVDLLSIPGFIWSS